jgi:hypothetical protein
MIPSIFLSHLWSVFLFCSIRPSRGIVFEQVKGEVQTGINYLLQKRNDDRYRHFIPRTLFEVASGGRQAPTFSVP